MALTPALTRGAPGLEVFSNPHAPSPSTLADSYLDALPDPVFLLGLDGRITRANARALSWLNKQSLSQAEGHHLHELIQASDWKGAIDSIEGKLLSRFLSSGILPRNVNLHLGIQGECEITDYQDQSSVLKVSLKKIFSDGHTELLLSVQDITEIKCKELLQNLFMHDLANRVTEVIANSELLTQICKKGESDSEKLNRWSENIKMISKELGLEISAQQAIASMELNKMEAQPEKVESLNEIQNLASHFYPLVKLNEISLNICATSKDLIVYTDPVLLRRVLTNLVKNAIEASQPGDDVTLGCRLKKNSGMVEFWIHNPGFINKDHQEHLFKPYFSTKESTRGLGTYSIKFLTEFFLKGTVDYQTSEQEGTCFRVAYPLSLETKLSA